LLTSTSSRGFTLIELLTGLAVFGMLMAVAMPAFSTFMQNRQILALANSFNTALQTARTEAIRRSIDTQFVQLAISKPATEVSINEATGDVDGQNWIIRSVSGGAFQFIEGRGAQQGGTQRVSVTGGQPMVTFNALGVTGLAANTIFLFSPVGATCTAADAIRCLSVRLSASGQSRLCDPLIAAPTDTRTC